MKSWGSAGSAVRFALALTAGACCAGETYYVGLAGDDTGGGGSRSNAWRTLQKAVDSVGPGDTIVVLGGTYAGARIEVSGSRVAPITVRADVPGEVLLNALSPANRRGCVLEIETYAGSGVVSNIVVDGMRIAGSPSYGVRAQSTRYVALLNNIVTNNQSTGIFTPFCYDTLIEGNVCADNGEHGIYHNNSSDRFLIRGNDVHHNLKSGIHLNGDIGVEPPPGTPWAWDGVISDGIIENNTIHENGGGGAGINMDGVTRTIIRNNVLYKTPNNSGIALFRQDAGAGSSDNWIVNNVVLMAKDAGWCINLAGSDCINNKVFNNLLFHPASSRGSIVLYTSALQGFESDYNSTTDAFSTDNGGSRISGAQWRALGYDTHAIADTPPNLFVSHATRDYRLKTGSLAIDAGRAHLQAALDKDGIARPLDGRNNATAAWDMGAFEFVHASVDSDRDLSLDRHEVLAGTNPTDPHSVLRFESTRLSAGRTVLGWQSASGRYYRVLGLSTDLLSSTPLAEGIEATPPLNTHTQEQAAKDTGFFRIGLESR